jgi:truncated hemoglobin YjbI
MTEMGRHGGIVDARRQDPFFSRHTLSGKTYATGSGAVIPNELQYYDGQMVHVYGECTNVANVNLALAGSGYRPVTLRHSNGTITAAAQLWISRFTQTTIGAYNAMFLVVVAARDDAPDSVMTVPADATGATSAIVMIDGSYDAAARVYENRRRLFLVRLLDSTQVAIDVGRERMGTDKRPGTITLQAAVARLTFAIADGRGAPVARGRFALPADPASFMPALARAAAAARVSLRSYPDGTEFVYPSVARIDRGPLVHWEWRSDAAPQLCAVPPNAVEFSASSEEGRLALSWGFTPRAIGYIAHVRGVITGLKEVVAPREEASHQQRAPAESPEHLPVLRPAGHVRAVESAKPYPAQRQYITRAMPCDVGSAPASPTNVTARKPRWTWETKFFGSLTAFLRKELVGPTPDGLRINWHVIEGSFVGPGFEAIVLPGAADWMRIRRDGVAIVSVQACFELKSGARVYGSYGGVFDLGPDGYTRALRDDFDPLPPVVVTPTYATADPELAWLNRAQCIGVGRVDMAALRVEFDVYLARVGGAAPDGGRDEPPVRTSAPHNGTLYSRMGGYDVIAAIADDFLVSGYRDQQLTRFFQGQSDATKRVLRQHVVNLLCELTGGSSFYFGRDMKTTHRGLGITESDWRIAFRLFADALDKHRLGAREKAEFLQIIDGMKNQVVERP